MEIALVSPQSIRIKGKAAAFVVNPKEIKTKTTADAILLLARDSKPDLSKVDEYHVVISGAGDYEVSGVKIGTLGQSDTFCHLISIDGIEVCATSASFLVKKKDTNRECGVLALYCDETIEPSSVTELGPRAIVLYGDKAEEFVKSLGKESVKSSKFVAASDKLPEEMQVVVLS